MKWRIGDVTVTKIVEVEMTGGSRFILPDATPEAIRPISWLIPHFADENGRLKMSKLDKPGFGVRLNPACELHRPYPR